MKLSWTESAGSLPVMAIVLPLKMLYDAVSPLASITRPAEVADALAPSMVKPSIVAPPTPRSKAASPVALCTMLSAPVRPLNGSTSARAPTKFSPFVSLTFSEYVPGQTKTVSPVDAAATAAEIVV